MFLDENWCESHRSVVIQTRNCGFFGTGMIVVDLKQKGTVAIERERLKMSVVTLVSSEAQSLSKRPGMLSGPAALREFINLINLCWGSASVPFPLIRSHFQCRPGLRVQGFKTCIKEVELIGQRCLQMSGLCSL